MSVVTAPRIFALCGPSGSGKSTLVRALLEREPRPFFSLAVTTRPPRAGEADGRDYMFVSPGGFEALQAAGALLEAAVRFGHWYGELREPVAEALARGQDVLVDTDPGGARAIGQAYPGRLVSIGLVPPSLQEVEVRLRMRPGAGMADLRARVGAAAAAILELRSLDHLVLTDDIERVVHRVQQIRGIAQGGTAPATGIEKVMQEAAAAASVNRVP